MQVPFTKINGLGNDFVFIDDPTSSIDLTAEQVQHICDRHFGIGADGVILVRPSVRRECAAYMHYINSDGTLAQMCGNGIRCFAKYLVENGMGDSEHNSLVVDTLSGPHPIRYRTNGQGSLVEATVDMGEPILDPAEVPVDADACATGPEGQAFAGEIPLESPWGTFTFTCVSMGNPHAVCFIDDFATIDQALFAGKKRCLSTLDIGRVGAYFESHAAFPQKANIEFATIEDDGGAEIAGAGSHGTARIRMRVYERGCGETLACGTGACATAVAARLLARVGRKATLSLAGGDLLIEWRADNHIYMTGPAEIVFTGRIYI